MKLNKKLYYILTAFVMVVFLSFLTGCGETTTLPTETPTTVTETPTNPTEASTTTVTESAKAELTFSGFDGTITLDSLSLNEATMPTVTPLDHQVFVGWATSESGDVVFTSDDKITYDSVKNLLTDEKITLYPVFSTKYDLVVAIWQESGGDEPVTYITDSEVETIKTGFVAYLKSLEVDTTNLLINYIQVKGESSNEFNADVNDNSTVDVAISGANMASDAADPSIVLDVDYGRVKVGSDHFENTKRYVGVVKGHSENELSVKFYDFMKADLEVFISVTLKGETDVVTKLSSTEANEATMPTVAEKTGFEFAGWATTIDAAQAELTVAQKINYQTTKALAVDGVLVLYPVYTENLVKNDLVVAIIIGTSETNIVITPDDLALIKTGFASYLKDTLKDETEYTIDWRDTFYGKGADFVTTIVNASGDVDFVIGASNLTAAAQGLVILDETEWKKIVNPAISSSSRYCGYNKDCTTEHKTLADALFNYLTVEPEKTVEVTLIGDTSEVTILSSKTLNNPTVPLTTAPTGKEFGGWVLQATATKEDIAATTEITYNTVKDLATDGKVTLYAYYKDKDEVKKDTLVVAIYLSASKTTYITDSEVETIKSGFTAYLTAQGVDTTNLEITWKTKGGVNAQGFCDYVLAEGDVDVCIGGSNMTTSTTPIVAAKDASDADYKASVKGVTFAYTDSARYVVIVDGSATNSYAVNLYTYLSTEPTV